MRWSTSGSISFLVPGGASAESWNAVTRCTMFKRVPCILTDSNPDSVIGKPLEPPTCTWSQEHVLHVSLLEGFALESRGRLVAYGLLVRVGTTPCPEFTRHARDPTADGRGVAQTCSQSAHRIDRGCILPLENDWLCSRRRIQWIHPHEANFERIRGANSPVALDKVRDSLFAAFHVPVNVHEVLVQRIRDPGWRHRVQICDTMRGTTHQTRTG